MLELVKIALRVTSSEYDAELLMHISAALDDLGLTDISKEFLKATTTDALICQAVITYCAFHFGNPEDPERLKTSYDEQKAQLLMSSQYTDWTR